jgi:peptidyl-prolyl cis-trans isomerase SDCCAG10
MACDDKAKNASQFFITLGPCEWLNGKNTIFAKITGDTIFNVMKVAECETDEDDRPVHALHRILKTEVLFNPFDDIVPREKKTAKPKKEKKKRKKKT